MLAVDLEDESRKHVLKEEMDFYAEAYLRNARLLRYWSEAGGGWINCADPSSIAWFREEVLENPDFPLSIEPDAEGILPGFEWRAAAE